MSNRTQRRLARKHAAKQGHTTRPGAAAKVPQIADNLKALGLEFAGFEFKKDLIARRYAEHSPQDPGMTDLSRWAAFEERYPDTFIGMYKFWCQKPAVR